MSSAECQVAARLIQENVDEMDHVLLETYPHSELFERLCFYKWAALEIIGLLQVDQAVDAIERVEFFRGTMDYYSTCNSENSYRFSIAYDAATSILDLLISGLLLEDY